MSRKLVAIMLLTGMLLIISSCSNDDTVCPTNCDVALAEAVEIIINDVIPAAVPEGATYICQRMIESLPAGSTIVEYAPSGPKTAAQVLTVDRESYFFYLDLAPASFYSHPVKYIVVDKESGDFGVTDASWWPVINGQTPPQFIAEYPDTNYVVAGNANLQVPVTQLMMFDIPAMQLQTTEGFIVIQGLMLDEALFGCAMNTYYNGIEFFSEYANATSEVEGLIGAQAVNVFDEIDDMAEDGKDVITIYIIAHGLIDSIRLGGYWVSVLNFRNKMEEHPNVLFNFLLGSCHAGSFIDNLQSLSNVRVVLTACTAAEGAQRDWDHHDGLTDYNLDDSGSEWTSSLLDVAGPLAADTENFNFIQHNAADHGIPVTSELLYEVHFGAIGQNTGFELHQNLDLSSRTGDSTPQAYFSWE